MMVVFGVSFYVEMMNSTLRELLDSWNTSLEKQANQYVSMGKKVRETDALINNYFLLLQQLEQGISVIHVGIE